MGYQPTDLQRGTLSQVLSYIISMAYTRPPGPGHYVIVVYDEHDNLSVYHSSVAVVSSGTEAIDSKPA